MDAVGFGRPGAQLFEPQSGGCGWEQVVLEQPPAPLALGFQKLVVLTQKLHRVVVLAQTLVPIPLAPKPRCRARGINGPLHPDFAGVNCLSEFGICDTREAFFKVAMVSRPNQKSEFNSNSQLEAVKYEREWATLCLWSARHRVQSQWSVAGGKFGAQNAKAVQDLERRRPRDLRRGRSSPSLGNKEP